MQKTLSIMGDWSYSTGAGFLPSTDFSNFMNISKTLLTTNPSTRSWYRNYMELLRTSTLILNDLCQFSLITLHQNGVPFQSFFISQSKKIVNLSNQKKNCFSLWVIQSSTKSAALILGGFQKWWYPTTMGFPTKNDHLGVFWGYHHLRKHPYIPNHHSTTTMPPPPHAGDVGTQFQRASPPVFFCSKKGMAKVCQSWLHLWKLTWNL